MQLPIECAPMQLETLQIPEICIRYDINNGAHNIRSILFDTGEKWLQVTRRTFAVSVKKSQYFSSCIICSHESSRYYSLAIG